MRSSMAWVWVSASATSARPWSVSGRLGLIDVRDIAEFAGRVLTDPAAHAGRTYTLTGPASISLHDAASAASSSLGARITYQSVPAGCP